MMTRQLDQTSSSSWRTISNLNHTIGHPMQDGTSLPPEELFDLQEDPAEANNLANQPNSKRSRMR